MIPALPLFHSILNMCHKLHPRHLHKRNKSVACLHSPLLHFHFPEDTYIVYLPQFIVDAIIMQQAKIYGVLVQGWHGVESTHPPLMWCGVQIPVFAPYVGWVSSWLVLSFAPRGFSPGTPVFFSPQKPTFPNSNLTRDQVDEAEPLSGCATSKSLYFIITIFLLQRRLAYYFIQTPIKWI